MKKHLLLLILISLFLSTLFFFKPVVANAVTLDPPIPYLTFAELLNAIIKVIFNISLAVVPLMIIIAGVMFITAAGNPQQIDTAKRIIFYTLIGFIIILLSRGIMELLKEIFVKQP